MCVSCETKKSLRKRKLKKRMSKPQHLHFQLYKRIILLKYYFFIYNKCLTTWCFHVVPIYSKQNNVTEGISPREGAVADRSQRTIWRWVFFPDPTAISNTMHERNNGRWNKISFNYENLKVLTQFCRKW